jgi:predicted alpha/beta-fold hydrolase
MCRKVHDFKSVTELYQWSSCVNYLQDISIPMIFINARDDPIVPEALLQPIRQFACELIKPVCVILVGVSDSCQRWYLDT